MKTRRLFSGRLRAKVREEVRLRGTEIPFLIFLTFFVTFAGVRTYVWVFNIPEATHLQTNIFGYRIHHYWWGILLISIAGWMAITHKGRNVDRTAAVLYGMGLGILIDEAGLLLTEHIDYYSMSTYSLVVSITLLLLSITFLPWFWVAVKKEMRKRRDNVMKLGADIAGELEDGAGWAGSNIKRMTTKKKKPGAGDNGPPEHVPDQQDE